MRLVSGILSALALASLAAGPAVAAPSASKLSLAQGRAATPMGNANEARGFLLPGIAIAAVIVGIIIIASDDDDSDSP